MLVLSVAPLIALKAPRLLGNEKNVSTLLKSLNLCFASTVISIITVLNFPLAASLAIILGLPLSLSSSHSRLHLKLIHYVAYAALATGWLGSHSEVTKMVWDWQMLGVWFCPVICMIYTPLVIQAGLVCIVT